MNSFFVRHQENAHGIVVAFSSRATPPGKFTFWRVLENAPYHIVFVNDPDAQWYLNGVPDHPSESQLVEFLKSEIAKFGLDLPVYTLGSSMGAYAALRYGAQLDAERILAFAPEVALGFPLGRSIASMPKITPGSEDIRNLKFKNPKNVTIISGNGDVVDYYSLCALKEGNPEVNVVALNNLPHVVAQNIDERHGIQNLILPYLEGADASLLDKYQSGKIISVKLAESVKDCNEQVEAGGDIAKFRDAMAAVVSKCPDWGYARYLYGLVLLKSNDLGSALEQFRLTTNAVPTLARARFRLATLLLKMKKFDEAVMEFSILRDMSNTISVSLNLSRALQAQGRLGLAIDALERAPVKSASSSDKGLWIKRLQELSQKVAAKC